MSHDTATRIKLSGDALTAALAREQLIERWEYPPTLPPRRKRKPRKPSVARLIKQAERSGKKVTSITLPDGATLHFGESETTAEATNPWLAKLEKVSMQ